ncbi:hypothetical protein C5E10_13285 [Pseudoclavibacter sp. RFBG4]|nr:hypothetical protein C5E10_13285 [Pseudoclavibacter sp. RFBG4]
MDHTSRLLRRQYDYIEVVEFDGEDDSVMPWFKVSSHGSTYDTLSMGRGELSAIHLVWRLSRISKGEIVVIDEPEANLATYSQSKLKDLLAYISTKGDTQFIVATHAPDFYLGLLGDCVTVAEALPVRAARGPMSSRAAARALGVPARPSLVAVAEDAAAGALLDAIIHAVDPAIQDSVQLCHATDGESQLARMENELVTVGGAPKIRIIPVFDGDQRKRGQSSDRLYLPGDLAPEQNIRSVLTRMLPVLRDDSLREAGVSHPQTFRMKISQLDGSDHHDWFVELSQEFGSYAVLSAVLVNLCMKDKDFALDAGDLVRRIRALA